MSIRSVTSMRMPQLGGMSQHWRSSTLTLQLRPARSPNSCSSWPLASQTRTRSQLSLNLRKLFGSSAGGPPPRGAPGPCRRSWCPTGTAARAAAPPASRFPPAPARRSPRARGRWARAWRRHHYRPRAATGSSALRRIATRRARPRGAGAGSCRPWCWSEAPRAGTPWLARFAGLSSSRVFIGSEKVWDCLNAPAWNRASASAPPRAWSASSRSCG